MRTCQAGEARGEGRTREKRRGCPPCVKRGHESHMQLFIVLLLAQVYLRPYSRGLHNFLEVTTLITLFFTLMAGLLYYVRACGCVCLRARVCVCVR